MTSLFGKFHSSEKIMIWQLGIISIFGNLKLQLRTFLILVRILLNKVDILSDSRNQYCMFCISSSNSFFFSYNEGCSSCMES